MKGDGMSFTPGPWEAVYDRNQLKRIPIIAADGTRIANVKSFITPRCRDEAFKTASLIASAPEMYDLISRAIATRVDDSWIKDARRIYLKAGRL